MLAGWAVVGAASAEDDSSDGGTAYQAGLAGAEIDFVFELEEAAGAVGIDIIGHRGAAEGNGFA